VGPWGVIPWFVGSVEYGNSYALSNGKSDGLSNVLFLLINLADHGEFVAMWYLDGTDADMKSSVARQSEPPSRRSLRLLMAVGEALDRLRVLPLLG
jgi:hypothetical protein